MSILNVSRKILTQHKERDYKYETKINNNLSNEKNIVNTNVTTIHTIILNFNLLKIGKKFNLLNNTIYED